MGHTGGEALNAENSTLDLAVTIDDFFSSLLHLTASFEVVDRFVSVVDVRTKWFLNVGALLITLLDCAELWCHLHVSVNGWRYRPTYQLFQLPVLLIMHCAQCNTLWISDILEEIFLLDIYCVDISINIIGVLLETISSSGRRSRLFDWDHFNILYFFIEDFHKFLAVKVWSVWFFFDFAVRLNFYWFSFV